DEHLAPGRFSPQVFIPRRFGQVGQRRESGTKADKAARAVARHLKGEPLWRLGSGHQAQALLCEGSRSLRQVEQRLKPVSTTLPEMIPKTAASQRGNALIQPV